jgi:hypothetical protein
MTATTLSNKSGSDKLPIRDVSNRPVAPRGRSASVIRVVLTFFRDYGLPPDADILTTDWHVSNLPKGDIARLLELKQVPREAVNDGGPAPAVGTERGALH